MRSFVRLLTATAALCLPLTSQATSCELDNPLKAIADAAEGAAGGRVVRVLPVWGSELTCILGDPFLSEDVSVSKVHYGPVRDGAALRHGQIRYLARALDGVRARDILEHREAGLDVLRETVAGVVPDADLDLLDDYARSVVGESGTFTLIRYHSSTHWGLSDERAIAILQKPGTNELFVMRLVIDEI